MPLFSGPNIKKLKAKRDIHGLVAVAVRDDKLDRRKEALLALGQLRDPAAVPPVVEALRTPDLSATAALVLGDLGDRRAVEPLLGALGDGDTWVRGCAATALGKLGDARAVPALIALLGTHEHNTTRSLAALALSKIGGPEAASALSAARASEAARSMPNEMFLEEVSAALDRITERSAPEKTAFPRTFQRLLVLSVTEVPGIDALLQQIVDQQRDRGHDIDPRFRAVARVTSEPGDAAYVYAAVRSEFPDLDPEGLADRTERFDFQGLDGTAGHYYIVFDRPRPDVGASPHG